MKLSVATATAEDAGRIAAMRSDVAADLTRRHGFGHWSSAATERGVVHGIKSSCVLIARSGTAIVGTLRLATKKPWAIDTKYFTAVPRAIYLLDMAVDPRLQRHGIGRRLIDEARKVVRRWPGDAIRLDAYDANAGAGGFYEKCGFRQVGRATYRGVPLVYFELLV